MSNLTAADVPAIAKQAIIKGVENDEIHLSTVLVAIVDLQRTYPDILIDGSPEQRQTWQKYLPEIETETFLNLEQYEQIVADIYEEYAKQELTKAVNEYLATNLPADEEVVEWKLVLDPGDGSEPFVVTNNDSGTVGLLIGNQSGKVVLTDLPEPTYADAEPGSVYSETEARKSFVDVLAELDEETLKATENTDLPAAFDVEAAADNVIPDSAPTQPKWGC